MHILELRLTATLSCIAVIRSHARHVRFVGLVESDLPDGTSHYILQLAMFQRITHSHGSATRCAGDDRYNPRSWQYKFSGTATVIGYKCNSCDCKSLAWNGIMNTSLSPCSIPSNLSRCATDLNKRHCRDPVSKQISKDSLATAWFLLPMDILSVH